jgi:hypothetical protein
VAVRALGGWSRAVTRQDVAVWGEFEPETEAFLFERDPKPGEARSWHRLSPLATPPRGSQNTDPWIFGSAFRYAICRQRSLPYLRNLQAGDLVLFGSYRKQGTDGRATDKFSFFLDTVFVVNRGYPLANRGTIPSRLLDKPYLRAAYDRFSARSRDICTLYEAAMLGRTPSSAPFSFSPCRVTVDGQEPARMRRPMISGLFNKRYGNGQVVTRLHREPTDAWERIVEHCRELGYELAVAIENPRLAPGSQDRNKRRPGRCHLRC